MLPRRRLEQHGITSWRRQRKVALLDHDDELNPHALYWAVKLLQEHPEAGVIYSDEDKLELDGSRSRRYSRSVAVPS